MPQITVASKLPFGVRATFNGKTVTFAGRPANSPPQTVGLTFNVDADWFAGWVAEAKDFAPLEKGLIYSAKSEADANAQAKELAEVKTGLEQKSGDELGVLVSAKNA
jgi:hypothetical protein